MRLRQWGELSAANCDFGDADYGRTRTNFPAKPVAEGVYALVKAAEQTHLFYVITVPKEIHQVQEEFGLADRGSWGVRVRNPSLGGTIGEKAEMGKE